MHNLLLFPVSASPLIVSSLLIFIYFNEFLYQNLSDFHLLASQETMTTRHCGWSRLTLVSKFLMISFMHSHFAVTQISLSFSLLFLLLLSHFHILS